MSAVLVVIVAGIFVGVVGSIGLAQEDTREERGPYDNDNYS